MNIVSIQKNMAGDNSMEYLVEVQDLRKVFQTRDSEVEALSGINLQVEAGDIYGIIGMSGAGKSTLVRCLNYLEVPTQGRVLIEGQDLRELSPKELRKLRSNIGMIFQGFNLLMQKSVIDNICFPLLIQGQKKEQARQRARELLKTVDLAEKENAFPAQLSGGQKQRVAIARALASRPRILLCDEATSALDPQTTASILALLKKINEETGITIIIITHQMSVVHEICRHVAIIEKGHLVESGTVEEIFTHPKSHAARRMVIEGRDPDDLDPEEEETKIGRRSGPAEGAPGGRGKSSGQGEMDLLLEKRRIRIVYTKNSSFEPVIGNMVLRFGTPVNILRADTKDVAGVARGDMILGLPDDPGMQEQMINYLLERGLAVEEV